MLEARQQGRPAGMQTEVFVFGRLPLAFSARCFTARAHNLPKDQCEFRCGDYPDGMPLATREQQAFLTLNGIQVQSAGTCNLVRELPVLAGLGVDVVRISPQSRHMPAIIDTFAQVVDGQLQPEDAAQALEATMPAGPCDGYWYGGAGMSWGSQAEPRAYPASAGSGKADTGSDR